MSNLLQQVSAKERVCRKSPKPKKLELETNRTTVDRTITDERLLQYPYIQQRNHRVLLTDPSTGDAPHSNYQSTCESAKPSPTVDEFTNNVECTTKYGKT